ncbi:MAG: tRNA glutamyl-Q(34) synthetase GluQRS [Hyphomicrobiales bacterium]|nr:tRNA glutamyl-Q(34) synthetase GluQRS [Hyphomicrobiales bacterium]
MNRPVFRFAPSPNGDLHLGHAYSALLNQQMAASVGGRLLLRIEDIDLARCTPQFEAGIARDLEWLGIAWETPVRRQSEHFEEYAGLLGRLIADDLVYPAFMSRGEVRAAIAEMEASGKGWPRDPDGAPLYPGLDKQLGKRERERRIKQGDPFAWRLDTDRAAAGIGAALTWTEFSDVTVGSVRNVAAEPELWGDVVLARRDVATSYNLSVVADDALQGVTHVARGLDLYSATAIHRLLQALLNLPEPLYHHHRLIAGPDGRKLSKSQHDTGIAALRSAGFSPNDIRRMVGLDMT